jgi:hypothetical protein
MASSLVLQLGLGTLTVATTVLVHLAGLAALIALMRVHRQFFSIRQARLNQAVILVGAGFGLFALHTAEIWGYAVLFWLIAATPTFEDALYYSTVTYATIGYGDVTLSKAWRILGAIEGANGVILLGWSTAFFVSVVTRIRALEHEWSESEA